MAEPYYAQAAELRSYLGLTAMQLDDADATELIQRAEDLVDQKLGGWPMSRTTGRKIMEPGTIPVGYWPHEHVFPWQWEKLKRATLACAKFVRDHPDRFVPREWASISGPDFSMSQPISATGGEALLPTEVLAPLNQSRLRRPMGRAIT